MRCTREIARFFLHGFAKNERDNVSIDESATLKKIAAEWLKADAAEIKRSIDQRILIEVTDEG